MKILPLGSNSTKFYTHNLWTTRRLKMQKMGAEGEYGVGARDPGEGGMGGRCVLW